MGQQIDAGINRQQSTGFSINQGTAVNNTNALEHPDKFGVLVTKARAILASQTQLIPKAATNTAENTNVLRLDRTIGDLADLVEQTVDPVWREMYRVALVRCLAASEKAKAGVGATPNSSKAITDAQQDVVSFDHQFVGIVLDSPVSSHSARQAGYQQRFNPPPPPVPFLGFPLDPIAGGSEYNWIDIPGRASTAIRTQTNKDGSYVQEGRDMSSAPLGTSNSR